MPESPSLLVTILAFLLVLGPLVIVHELGHYLVGRWFAIRADAFSVGFGKELWGRTDRRGTRWKLSALPLGGYVQFAGDMNAASTPGAVDPALPAEERAGLFQFKPLWQRCLVVLAGPVANLLAAIAIFAAFNLIDGKLVETPDIAGFEQASPAQAAGLRLHDRIVAIDGAKIDSFGDVFEATAPYPGQTVTVTVERAGRALSLPVRLSPVTLSDRFGNSSVQGSLGIDFIRPVIGGFRGDSTALAAGLKENDVITALDGQPVGTFADVADHVRPRAGQTIAITVLRGASSQTFRVPVASAVRTGHDGKPVRTGMLGIRPGIGKTQAVGPVEAVTLAVRQTWGVIRMMVTGIVQILGGERSVKELGGPVKIAKYSGEQFSLGWDNFVYFAALISINLAFINLLPIPGLDGGHLAFYAAEAVRRKPLGLRSQEWAIRTGVALVVALMLFVTFNDLASLPLFGG